MDDKIRSLIEDKIQKGMQEGAFDNLPGKGEPLKLDDDNPFEDPSLRMGYRLLRNNGFTLPWIQEQKEIALAAERLGLELARSWMRAERERVTGGDRWQAQARWLKAASAFRHQVAELNERINNYNLQVPADRFRRQPLDAEREITRIAQPLTRAEMGLSDMAAPTDPPQSGSRKERRSLLLKLRGLWQRLRLLLTGQSLLRVNREQVTCS